MNKIIMFILSLTISSFSFGDKLSDSDYKKVETIVFENLQKENYLKLNRITSEGKLTSCELEFGHVYKDFRSQLGKPVIVSGSYSLMYLREKKNVMTTLKVVPTVLDVKTEKMIQTYPEYLDFKINKNSLSKFMITDFKCGTENNGRCLGYGDNKLSMLKTLTSVIPFNGDVVFSLTKGGYDNTFTLSNLLPPKESTKVRGEFNSCMSEILEELIKDLDKK
jgi:hypothetical protein